MTWHGVTTNGDGRVTALDLADNSLTGTLPAALGDLDELEELDLEDNDLSGALPTELADLTKLASLLLARSRALTGPLPDGLRERRQGTPVRGCVASRTRTRRTRDSGVSGARFPWASPASRRRARGPTGRPTRHAP